MIALMDRTEIGRELRRLGYTRISFSSVGELRVVYGYRQLVAGLRPAKLHGEGCTYEAAMLDLIESYREYSEEDRCAD